MLKKTATGLLLRYFNRIYIQIFYNINAIGKYKLKANNKIIHLLS